MRNVPLPFELDCLQRARLACAWSSVQNFSRNTVSRHSHVPRLRRPRPLLQVPAVLWHPHAPGWPLHKRLPVLLRQAAHINSTAQQISTNSVKSALPERSLQHPSIDDNTSAYNPQHAWPGHNWKHVDVSSNAGRMT